MRPDQEWTRMQTENRLFDDLARMANGAFSTLSSVREEVETRVRERVERLLADMDLVPREEFEAVKAMAQKARLEQEALAAKVGELEQRLEATSKPKRAGARAAKPAPGKSSGGRRRKSGTAAPEPA